MRSAVPPKYLVAEENLALVRSLGTPRTVLDVGCGIGLNGAAAKRTGARVTGIETDPGALEEARVHTDRLEALCGPNDNEVVRLRLLLDFESA